MTHVFRFLGHPINEHHWLIADEELTHLRQVLRLSQGASVEVMDGHGLVMTGTLADITSKQALVRIESSMLFPPSEYPLHLCLGALKPGAIDEALPSIVELGADGIHVFSSEGAAKWRLNEKALERWRRIVLGAAKQCKRPFLPEIVGYDDLAGLVQRLPANLDNRFTLDPGGRDILFAPFRPAGTVCVIGGEHGLSEPALKILEQSGFIKVSMGPSILRAFTASIAACALLDTRRRSLS